MSLMKAKVPAVVASGLICLVVGGGLGAGIMSYASRTDPQAQAAGDGDENGKGPGDLKGPDAKGGKGGKGGKGPGGAGGGGPKGPSPKVQLTQLITKLDTLTGPALHVDLTPEQKKQVKDQLAGLDQQEAITDEEAKAKLDALLKLLEANKKTFEDAGYRWPGAGGGPPMGGAMGAPLPPNHNPFRDGEPGAHLKAVQTKVEK